jgi:hypothetical protein
MNKDMKEQVLRPKHPERTCWGCDRYCPAGDLVCGNGTIRTPHPVELFGNDWFEWVRRNPANANLAGEQQPD